MGITDDDVREAYLKAYVSTVRSDTCEWVCGCSLYTPVTAVWRKKKWVWFNYLPDCVQALFFLGGVALRVTCDRAFWQIGTDAYICPLHGVSVSGLPHEMLKPFQVKELSVQLGVLLLLFLSQKEPVNSADCICVDWSYTGAVTRAV